MGHKGHTNVPQGTTRWRAALLAGGGFGVLALIGLLAVLVASPDLLRGPAAKPSATPVAATPLPGGILKIGVDLPLSGPYAGQGIPAENAVQLAIDQANTAGGVLVGGRVYQLALVARDDPIKDLIDNGQSAQNAQAFIDDPAVLGVVGPFNTGAAKEMMPAMNRAGLAHISPADDDPEPLKPEYGQTDFYRPTGKTTYFRVSTTYDYESAGVADYLFDQLRVNRLALLQDRITQWHFTEGVEKRFTARGGVVFLNEEMSYDMAGWAKRLTEHPDAIYYAGTTAGTAARVHDLLQREGFDSYFIGNASTMNHEFLANVAHWANGSYAIIPLADPFRLPSPEPLPFVKDYQRRFELPPRVGDTGFYSLNAYEAANILIDGLRRASAPTREAVRQALLTTDYNGILGRTHFDDYGFPNRNWVAVYRVENGQWLFQTQFVVQNPAPLGTPPPSILPTSTRLASPSPTSTATPTGTPTKPSTTTGTPPRTGPTITRTISVTPTAVTNTPVATGTAEPTSPAPPQPLPTTATQPLAATSTPTRSPTATSPPTLPPTAIRTTTATSTPTVLKARPTATEMLVTSTPTLTALPTKGAPLTTTRTITVSPTPTPGKGKVTKIGLVTDVGNIHDQSFNQVSWDGVRRGASLIGATAKYIETHDPKDYSLNIEQLVAEGYDPVVTVGFALGRATNDAAEKHPEVQFIGMDQFVNSTSPYPVPNNYATLVFHEDQAGFLAGALAALMTQTQNVGAVLGTDVVPGVWRYGEGFKAGAKYSRPDIKLQVVYHSDVDLSKTFNDPSWGKRTAKSMIDKGADVIFGAGGTTGNGALQGAAEQMLAGKTVYAIGVDSDQYYTVPEADPALLSSATLLISPGVEQLIESSAAGPLSPGNHYGDVYLAPFHDLDAQVPQAVQARLVMIHQGLKDGTILTNVPSQKPPVP